MYLADDNDFGTEPRRLLYDKSRCVKYVFEQNTSGNSPSNEFLLKFKMFNPLLLSRLVGIELEIWLESRFRVERTGIEPS